MPHSVARELLWQWLPASGGTGEYDTFARSGVNDGNQLTAGIDNAKSFGPVDTQLFIESPAPSLYDALNDMYDEPPKRNNEKRERCIPLSKSSVLNEHKHLTTQEKANREFDTIRPRPQNSTKSRSRPEYLEHAQLQLRGPLPIHLRVAAFNSWDGRTWSWYGELPAPTTNFELRYIQNKPWKLPSNRPELKQVSQREHLYYTLNYGDATLPMPSSVERFHMPQLDRPDFFAVKPDGQFKLQRETMPRLTSVRIVSKHVTEDGSSQHRFESTQYSIQQADTAVRQTTSWRPDPELDTLAKQIVAEFEPGWPQILAIVDYLRSNYRLDPNERVPEGTADAAKHFF